MLKRTLAYMILKDRANTARVRAILLKKGRSGNGRVKKGNGKRNGYGAVKTAPKGLESLSRALQRPSPSRKKLETVMDSVLE